MKSGRERSVLSTEGQDELMETALSEPLDAAKSLGPPARKAIRQTRQWLLAQQDPDGSWCAELEGDTILESETILLMAFLGQEDSDLARRLAATIVEKQLPDGGWAMYPGGPIEISGTVKAYFALKLTGHDPGAKYMRLAREAILAHGGADAVNSYTRFYLALLGQISYEQCPAVPPEVVLLPKWFPVSLYAVSAWSRTIIVPLSIISAFRPVRRLEPRLGVRELFLKEPEQWPPLRCPGLSGGTGLLSWDRFFRTVDRLAKWCQRRGLLPLRRKALAEAERWMCTRFDRSDGLGAIYPPLVWSMVALKCLGYPDDSTQVQYCHEELRKLMIEDQERGTARVQPCKSPVWDTAIAVRALAASGVQPDNPAMREAVRWLLAQQIKRRGDWSETVKAEPGGWAFEYANDFYPDNDDTAMVLMALQSQFSTDAGSAGVPPAKLDRSAGVPPAGMDAGRVRFVNDISQPPSLDFPELSGCFGAPRDGRQECLPHLESDGRQEYLPHLASVAGNRVLHLPRRQERPFDADGHQRIAEIEDTLSAIELGMRWMLAMQNRDGGWGAFDRNNNRKFLCHVPFADHNAMIDPSTPDLAGRVLEALGHLGRRLGDRAVDRAVAYVRRSQEADGSWFGRWGVNYIYGTWQAITGLVAVGVPTDDPAVVAGAKWLLDHQQPCGGWGESADSYGLPHLCGQGPPTASQTAWALMGLMAAGMAQHPAVLRGIRYLIVMQNVDGSWDESEFTGTGFPLVFYLRYHYYRIYFPLLALSYWAAKVDRTEQESDQPAAATVGHALA
jgi:squalene-hopene/tetraprenyl-beta-curcumene cyclase